jgi:hypothetical protein
MTLAGGRFTEDDARWVVEALLLKGEAEGVAAAGAIEVALESGADEPDLTEGGNAAIAAVLEEAWRARVMDESHLLVDGVAISRGDAVVLIDLLTQSGTKVDLYAAEAIEYARAEKHPSVDLSDNCRRAILGVLTDPQSEQLRELHAALAETFPAAAHVGTSSSILPPAQAS